ncbi:MAG: Gfo/Idh/MocA family oxidoreductase [Syntrophorhabdales bacterium]|jgi:predicted dehydrogenase
MPLRLCLIGAGHMGRIHAQKLAGMNDVTLTSIIDTDPAQATETARSAGTVGATDYTRALKDGSQAAVIASPTETHYPIARLLLENGIHVFVEKPIAAHPAEARELIVLAKKKGLVLQVGHLERFSPPFRKAETTIRDPLLIEARRIGPFTGRSTDIDVVHDLMIHDINLVLSLVKSDITRIDARGTPVLTEKIDVAHARIEFSGGCIATLTASRVSRMRERVFSVFEEDRYFSLNLAAGQMFSAKKGANGRMKLHTYQALRPDPVHDELKAFVSAVRYGTDVLVNGEDGLAALVLANTIQETIARHFATEGVSASS